MLAPPTPSASVRLPTLLQVGFLSVLSPERQPSRLLANNRRQAATNLKHWVQAAATPGQKCHLQNTQWDHAMTLAMCHEDLFS